MHQYAASLACSNTRIMPSADEAMVEDGRGRVQAYRPESCHAGRSGALRALAGEWIPSKKEFTSSRASRGRKNVVGSRGFLVEMRNRPRTVVRRMARGWPRLKRSIPIPIPLPT